MQQDFQSQLSGVIHGKYSVGGTMNLYVEPGQGVRRREGLALHEWVHSELIDNSAFGRIQSMLHTGSQLDLPASHTERFEELLQYTMASCGIVHEGLAAYRELCWLAANESAQSARRYFDSVPAEYREGIELTISVLGNPFDDPYQSLCPPAFHIAILTLGLAVMGSPILEHYADPDSIQRERLDWILINGPDQRFEEFCQAPRPLGPILLDFAAEVDERFRQRGSAPPDVEFVMEQYSLGIERIRDLSLPVQSRDEFISQSQRFNQNWIEHWNSLAGRKVVERRDSEDVTGQRMMNIQISSADYGTHEGVTDSTPPIEVAYDGLVGLAEGRQFEGVFRLTMVVPVAPDPSLDEFLESPVNVMSFPLGTTHAQDSPWLKGEPSIACQCSMQSFLDVSADLSELGWFWYLNQTVGTFLKELGVEPGGFAFERCTDPQHVILSQQHAQRRGMQCLGYVINEFHSQEPLVGVLYEHMMSFAFMPSGGLTYFREAAQQEGLEPVNRIAIDIGGQHVLLDQTTRWARWGALGH